MLDFVSQESQIFSDLLLRTFSRAAATYDAHADVQVEVARELLDRIRGRRFERILEVGCGTGLYTQFLAEAFPAAQIEAVDISETMLQVAILKVAASPRIRFVLAEGETPPRSCRGGYDLVTSSGTFQWFQDLEGAFQSYDRLMVPKGLLAFSAFGPETLKELNAALNEALGCCVALPARAFRDLAAWKSLLARIFGHVEGEERVLGRRYPDLISLLRRLKGTGVNCGGAGARLGLTRRRIGGIEDVYEKRFGAIRATYQVFFFQGVKS